MSENECIPIEELEQVAALPASDRRRAHLDGCPRCTARLAAYREFLEPTSIPQGARFEEADARLAAALDRELENARPAASAALEIKPARAKWTVRRLVSSPPLAWAAAAIAVAATATWIALPHHAQSVLRGRETAPAVSLLAPRHERARLTLAWEPVAGADRYEVRFFALDLTDLAKVDVGVGARLELSRAALPPRLAAGARVLWQVVALRGGDTIASSRTEPITLP